MNGNLYFFASLFRGGTNKMPFLSTAEFSSFSRFFWGFRRRSFSKRFFRANGRLFSIVDLGLEKKHSGMSFFRNSTTAEKRLLLLRWKFFSFKWNKNKKAGKIPCSLCLCILYGCRRVIRIRIRTQRKGILIGYWLSFLRSIRIINLRWSPSSVRPGL